MTPSGARLRRPPFSRTPITNQLSAWPERQLRTCPDQKANPRFTPHSVDYPRGQQASELLEAHCSPFRNHEGVIPKWKILNPDACLPQLAQRGIELIVPHRKNRRKPPTQDGRALRRYKRRWTVERTFAWLGNFRRLVVRYDRSLTIYQALFHIACFMIVLRRVLK